MSVFRISQHLCAPEKQGAALCWQWNIPTRETIYLIHAVPTRTNFTFITSLQVHTFTDTSTVTQIFLLTVEQ